MSRLATWTRLVDDTVFTDSCPGCGEVISDGSPWCVDCAQAILPLNVADYCPRCGVSVGPHLIRDDGCRACRADPTGLDGIARVGPYEGLLGQMVRRFKYGRQQRLDALLGHLLASAIQGREWLDELDALVPVPMTFTSRWRYRSAPVALLAEAAARECGLPTLPLVRCRFRGKRHRQVELSATERRKNVRGVFAVRRAARPAGARLCVVDDVATTGSTLREIARELKRAGAERVYGAVLVKTQPGRFDAPY